MLLTSYEFISFLLICTVLYYLFPKKFQWVMLLIGSYVFYFVSGGVQYIVILFSTTLLTYASACLIDKYNIIEQNYLASNSEELTKEAKKEYKTKNKKKKKRVMLAGLLLSLLILIVYKYTSFLVDNVNQIIYQLGSENEIEMMDIILPMGISFYTFQSIGYLIDVYWNKVKAEKNLLKHMLFVSFFPQLIQGPISRCSDLAKTLYQEHAFDWQRIKFGLERIIWGYFKKLVVADNLSPAAMTIIGDEYYTGAWVLVGLIFYSFELYADFSGGIDIAIGVAQIFGIELKENFRQPYFSKNINEYWRRWHITMGSWFRDYVFYPLSVSNTMNKMTKFFKNKIGKTAANKLRLYMTLMITWFATGIWHGASWNFIVWGLGNGILLCIADMCGGMFSRFNNKFPKLCASFPYAVFQMVRTFFLMNSLTMLDVYCDVPTAFTMYASMFTDFRISDLTLESFVDLGVSLPTYIVIIIGIVIIWIVDIISSRCNIREELEKKPFILRYGLCAVLLLMVVLFGAYGVGYDSSQFIYNQF